MTDVAGMTFMVEAAIDASKDYRDGVRHREPDVHGEQADLTEAWQGMLPRPDCGAIEAMSSAPPGTVECFTRQNMFAKAVHAAFYGHHRLVLSPDIIWTTIMQGLANHVDQSPEEMRSRLVNHQGREKIQIQRPGFVKGSPDNDWKGVFPEFASKIEERTVGGIAALALNDYSTSGPVERVVSAVTLMDAVQHYFSYSMCCGCGFPSITLTGIPADWERIRTKAEGLRAFDMDWWLDALLPALDQFVSASHGRADLTFWRSLCNLNTGTSFPVFTPISGWLQVFFPYLLEPGASHPRLGSVRTEPTGAAGAPRRAMRRNECLANYVDSVRAHVNAENWDAQPGTRRGMGASAPGTLPGVKLEHFPPGLSSAPFEYLDLVTGLGHEMAFFGGVTCLIQHVDGALEPRMGWAVLDIDAPSAQRAALEAERATRAAAERKAIEERRERVEKERAIIEEKDRAGEPLSTRERLTLKYSRLTRVFQRKP